MRYRLLTSLMIVIVVPFLVAAGQAPATRVRASELSAVPFIVDSIKLTFTKFNKDGPLGIGRGSIELRVENTSSAFITFSPERLSVVGSDNEQVNVLGVPVGNENIVSAEDRKVAPFARMKEYYELTGKLQLPARFYYDEKLIGIIAD